MSRAKYVDRALVTCPYYIALCKDEDAFKRELRRLKVPPGQWPPFLGAAHADATVHFLESRSNGLIALVTVKPRAKASRIALDLLLVHEAVHIWQETRRVLGEKAPSDEFEAYSIQHIAQRLIEAYHAG